MTNAQTIVGHLLEAEEDDFSVKDVVDPERPVAGRTTVKRHGRWKLVDMPGYTFLISYLTPVAYFDKQLGTYYETTKQWSPTTNGHIMDWKRQIYDSPEWQANPENLRPGYIDPAVSYPTYPEFHPKRQDQISKLFRALMRTMEMKPHQKKRLYHVAPTMRAGSEGQRQAQGYVSGHNKHHDSGEQGLPAPDKGDPFFQDFEPDEPNIWDWTTGYRNREPHEPGE